MKGRAEPGKRAQQVGFGFASLLSKHGLVEHSVWVSLEGRAGRIEDLDQKENRI